MKNRNILKVLVLLILFTFTISITYCAFSLNVSKTGTIETNELSTTLLDNASFLTQVQTIDPSITTIDKTTDLNRSNTINNQYIDDTYVVSTASSNVPTFLWVDSGTIYYYTIAETIDINNN